MAATVGFQTIVEQMPGLAQAVGQSTKVILSGKYFAETFLSFEDRVRRGNTDLGK